MYANSKRQRPVACERKKKGTTLPAALDTFVAQERKSAKKSTRCGAQERKSDEKVTHSGTGRGIEARKCDIYPAVRNRQGVEVENCHICPIILIDETKMT